MDLPARDNTLLHENRDFMSSLAIIKPGFQVHFEGGGSLIFSRS
jgi:hypothetical protein